MRIKMMVEVSLSALFVFSVLVFVEGQGQYVQPPSDNYNLTLDPFLAARFIFVNCSYEEDGVRISYKWTKDGAFFDPGGLPGRATVSVPNGDYSSSIEGIYSCTALVNEIPTKESRKTNVTLPVLFSVDVPTAVVTAGEAVTVNCIQTGYVRTRWSWRRNGAAVTSGMSERVYAELSARSRVGPNVPSQSVNHQSLYLHLWYARMMDNGVYTCVTETDTRTVTVDVQLPANVNFSDGGPVSYEVPLPFENTNVSYADFLYSGSEDNGMLMGGVGQLVDGVKGMEVLNTDKGRFPWVGWATPPPEIIFEFGSPHHFDSVTVHAYFSNSGVTWFGTIEVAISQNREDWNTFSSEINSLRGPQDVMTLTQMEDGSNAEGSYVSLRFDNIQGSGPMLISEVSFDSTPVSVPPFNALKIDLLVGVIVAVAALIIALLAASLAACCIMKKKKASVMAQASEGSVEDHSYPHDLENNPAYIAMETGRNLRLWGDEGGEAMYDYASPGMDRGMATSTPSDDNSGQSASYVI